MGWASGSESHGFPRGVHLSYYFRPSHSRGGGGGAQQGREHLEELPLGLGTFSPWAGAALALPRGLPGLSKPSSQTEAAEHREHLPGFLSPQKARSELGARNADRLLEALTIFPLHSPERLVRTDTNRATQQSSWNSDSTEDQ